MADEAGDLIEYRVQWQCRDYPACSGISSVHYAWPQTPPLALQRDECACGLQWVWRQPPPKAEKKKAKAKKASTTKRRRR